MSFNFFETPFFILFFFLVTSAGIIALSFLFTEAIKSILSRFRLSENFVGSSLLAAGTSLAEAINALTAGVYDRVGADTGIKGVKYSLDSFYNLTGAISIQVAFLSIVTLMRWNAVNSTKASRLEYKSFASAIFQNKTTLWSISTIEVVVLIVLFSLSSFSKKLNIGGYHILPFCFFAIWALYLTFTKKTKSEESSAEESTYSNIFQKYNNTQFLLVFSLIFVFFIALAFFNFNLVAQFEKVFSVPKNIGLGVVLSLITSFPEFASFTFLFISKCYKTACAGFLGSALFNLMLPTFTQLIKGGWLFESIDSCASEKTSLIFWLGSVLAVNLIFFLGFFRGSYENVFWKIKSDKWGIYCSSFAILTYFLTSFIFPIIFQSEDTQVT